MEGGFIRDGEGLGAGVVGAGSDHLLVLERNKFFCIFGNQMDRGAVRREKYYPVGLDFLGWKIIFPELLPQGEIRIY